MFSIKAALWGCGLLVYAYLLICMSQLFFQVTVLLSHILACHPIAITSHCTMSPQCNVSALLPNPSVHPFKSVLTVPQLSVALVCMSSRKSAKEKKFSTYILLREILYTTYANWHNKSTQLMSGAICTHTSENISCQMVVSWFCYFNMSCKQ